MLLAHIGDTHIQERSGDAAATLEEQVALLKWCGEDAAREGAAVILHGGDVFDSASTPAERKAAIEVFTSWAVHLPVVVVRGNHDRPLDLHYLGRLRTRHPVTVLEQPQVIEVAGATVACLPWPRKAQLVAAMGSTSTIDVNATAAAAMRDILQGFRAQLSAVDGPRILLGHVELGGASLDNGQPVAGRCDVPLYEGDLLDAGADVACLSHIHLHQVLGEGRIVYAGAPRPTRFGEEAAKGYCLIEVLDEPPHIEHRRAPYRPLITVRAAWDAEAERLTTEEDDSPEIPWKGPLQPESIRLVYEVSEANRKTAAVQAEEIKRRWLAYGAHSVKLDPRVTTTHRVRSETIRTARTTEDRLRAYWDARGETPDRAERILEKLSALEAAS